MQSHLKLTLVEATGEIAELCANGGTMGQVAGVIQSLPRRDRLARIRRLAHTVSSASQELSLLAAEESAQGDETATNRTKDTNR